MTIIVCESYVERKGNIRGQSIRTGSAKAMGQRDRINMLWTHVVKRAGRNRNLTKKNVKVSINANRRGTYMSATSQWFVTAQDLSTNDTLDRAVKGKFGHGRLMCCSYENGPVYLYSSSYTED